MHRIIGRPAGGIVLLVLLTLAAACQKPPDRNALTSFNVDARALGRGPDYIDVEVVFRSWVHQVDKVELVAPDGRRYKVPNLSTAVESAPGYGIGGSGTSVGVGAAGGSSGRVGGFLGIGIDITSLLNGGAREAPTVRTKGAIALPDPAAYRRDWQRWRLVVTVSRGGTEPKIWTVPAPKPKT